MAWSPHPRTDAWTDAMVELEVLVPDDVGEHACEVCGREPAAPVDLRAVEGYLLVVRRRRLQRRLCRSCAVGSFREHQARTWARGFAGIPAALFAPVALVGNLRRLRRALRGLRPPRPTAAAVEAGLRGPRVWARRGPWVPVVLVTLVTVAALVVAADEATVDELATGECFDVATPTAFGPGTGTTTVAPRPCTEPHLHEVVARWQHPAAPSTAYPGLLELDAAAFSWCLEAVPDLAERGDVALGVVYPTERGWDGGERGVTCIATSRTGPVVGSTSD